MDWPSLHRHVRGLQTRIASNGLRLLDRVELFDLAAGGQSILRRQLKTIGSVKRSKMVACIPRWYELSIFG